MIPECEGSTTAESAGYKPELLPPAEAARSPARYEHLITRRSARIDFICNVTFAVAALGIAVASLWPAPARHLHAPAPAVTSAAPVIGIVPRGPAEPQGAPLRIKNAFDRKEVFEFPPGTTVSEAREAVAELLLSRARERRAEASGQAATRSRRGGPAT